MEPFPTNMACADRWFESGKLGLNTYHVALYSVRHDPFERVAANMHLVGCCTFQDEMVVHDDMNMMMAESPSHPHPEDHDMMISDEQHDQLGDLPFNGGETHWASGHLPCFAALRCAALCAQASLW